MGVGNNKLLKIVFTNFFCKLTCDDNLGGLLGQDPVEEGPEVPAGETVGEPQQVGGQHDDEPGEQGVHHNVSRTEGEQEGRLQRLSHLCRIHGAFFYVAAVVDDIVQLFLLVLLLVMLLFF
jgi:hypothetical protein